MSNEQYPSPTDPMKDKGNHGKYILAELFEECGFSQHYKKNFQRR